MFFDDFDDKMRIQTFSLTHEQIFELDHIQPLIGHKEENSKININIEMRISIGNYA
jgi:hypothetical protein